MKQLKVLWTIVSVFMLLACGGGGTPQADPRNPVALYTSAPGSLSLASGSAAVSYFIGGGVAPYSASSSNPGVLVASVSGTTLTVTPTGAGSATLRVVDAKGASVTVDATVTAVAALALATTVPADLAMTAGALRSFTISGGTPPYAASGSNAAVLSAAVAGTTLNVSANAAGNASVVVFDSAGAQVSAAVTVGSATPVVPLFTSAPGAITLAVLSAGQYAIGGGTAPYLVSSSNTGVATVSVAGTALNIVGVANGSAQVLLLDATGTQIAIAVTVGSASAAPLFTTAPSAITVLALAPPANYAIGGGVPPYAASSSNNAVASATVAGSTLSITGLTTGGASVLVLDSVGSKVEIAATVGSAAPNAALYTTAPSAITLAAGAGDTFTIAGGTAPYAASSSANAVASATVSGTALTITARALGSASILVFDALGAQVNVAVTVAAMPASTALYTTAPSALNLNVGSTGSYAVLGGVAPYAVSSSNAGVLTATVSGSALSLTGVATGTASVLVFDSTGSQVSTTVTVGLATPVPALYTTAPNAIALAVAGVGTYTIVGGTAPYLASSSNTGVATVGIVNGNTLSILGAATGTAQLQVFDFSGARVVIEVTVGATTTTPLYTTAPSTVNLASVGAIGSYVIGGGVPPYAASSSNAAVASAAVSGTSLTVTGLSAGTATVVVLDAMGTKVEVNLGVGSGAPTAALYTTAPAVLTMPVSGVQTFQIGGGTAPYAVSSSNADVVTASVSGTALTITSGVAGSASVLVFDATGAQVAVAVGVGSAPPLVSFHTTAPSNVTLAVGGTDSYTISGGTAPYRTSSGSLAVASAAVTGTTLTITGVVAGTTQVLVFDATGSQVLIGVTVGLSTATPLYTTAHSTVTVATGAPAAMYTIGGGVPPYATSSSNTSVLRASVTGNSLSLTGVASGSATVLVLDANGASVTIDATVSAAGGGAPVGVPTLTLAIVDAAGVAVPTNSIGSGALFYVTALAKDASGNIIGNKLVSFSTDLAVATLAQPSALTNITTGIAKVQITPASLTLAGAGTLVAAATLDTTALSSSLDYQTAAANVTLGNMATAPAAISALQSTAVSVEARVDGVLAGASVVAVNFSASCGSFSPASASTNSAGVASSTYQSAASCSGAVTLTAQAAGAAAPATTSVTVAAAQPANIVFASASASTIVSSVATSGVKQSTLRFQVLDDVGAPMAGQTVSLALNPATLSAGVTFSVGGVPSTLAQTVSTDGSGYAAVIVSSGALPTPVIVTASLVSNPAILASSSGVAVTSGRATQNSASLAADKLSIEGFYIDGAQTTLTLRVADRQGNPVPAGAVVNFVTGYGQVQGTCTLDATSQCSVTYTSQGVRPANGRVVILAYLDGEESFVDQNGDNIWQTGEPFYALGTLYRDDNEDGSYNAPSEQTYPVGLAGAAACAADPYSYPSVLDTCDASNWNGNVRVRRQTVIAVATSDAIVTAVGAPRTAAGFTVRVTDLNGNAMPTGTTVAAAVVGSGATCTVSATNPGVVRNSSNGGNHQISLDGALDCTTVRVDVTVTSPGGVATVTSF